MGSQFKRKNIGWLQRIVNSIFSMSMIVVIICSFTISASAGDLSLSSAAYVLMDAKTGAVITSFNEEEERSPASITKIMTLYLIFEALDKGQIKLDDRVTVSDYAMSMGGSQVYLEAGEIQTVETLIKCIVVSSGNDASVAMAEYIAGSENEFVSRMNETANFLQMKHSHFADCCGLSDDAMHYMSALDVAILSRNLILKHPEIFNYTKIWMEDIVHETRRGSSVFTLSSTNKLLQQYEYTTGLKTGSTSMAKYCISATANKDGRELIAVIMGAPDPTSRFSEAKQLLEYGYNSTMLYEDVNEINENIKVSRAEKEEYAVMSEKQFSCVFDKIISEEHLERKIEFLDDITAPIAAGEKVGEAIYYLDGKEIGRVNIITSEEIRSIKIGFCLKNIFIKFLL